MTRITADYSDSDNSDCAAAVPCRLVSLSSRWLPEGGGDGGASATRRHRAAQAAGRASAPDARLSVGARRWRRGGLRPSLGRRFDGCGAASRRRRVAATRHSSSGAAAGHAPARACIASGWRSKTPRLHTERCSGKGHKAGVASRRRVGPKTASLRRLPKSVRAEHSRPMQVQGPCRSCAPNTAGSGAVGRPWTWARRR